MSKLKEKEAEERGLRDGANNAPMEAPYRKLELVQIYNRAWFKGRNENIKYEKSNITDNNLIMRIKKDLNSLRIQIKNH